MIIPAPDTEMTITLTSPASTEDVARFSGPNGVEFVDADLYVTEEYNNCIRKVPRAGAATTFAGTIEGHVDATGTAARFDSPWGIAAIGTDLYVADFVNFCIRKITEAGVVTTFAGTTSGVSGHVDDTGTAARFLYPKGIAAIGTDLYVAEYGNHCIRKITAAGVVTTFVGTTGTTSGHVDATGTAARFNIPCGLVAVGTDLYVADSNNHCIRKVTSAGVVTTFAGTTGTTSGHVDATGTAARFNFPQDIAVIGTDLYVTDQTNNCIRKVTAAGIVTTFAGTTGTTYGHVDDTGTAARFRNPSGITSSGTDLYVADAMNNCIRKITTPAARVSTYVGSLASFSGHVDYDYQPYSLVLEVA